MGIESDLVAFISADPQISALVGNRIYSTGIKPQNSDSPAITFSPVGIDWTFTLGDQQGLPGAHQFDFDAWSPEISEARELRNLLRARLQNYNGLMGSTRVDRIFIATGFIDLYENQIYEYRSSFSISMHVVE